MKKLLTTILLFAVGYCHADEIVIREGESIHDALRQAREWRRTNDARCQGGITITLQEGRLRTAARRSHHSSSEVLERSTQVSFVAMPDNVTPKCGR